MNSITLNKYGTAIFDNPNIECQFYLSSFDNKKKTEFDLCINPVIGYNNRINHSMVVKCPEKCTFCELAIDRSDEFGVLRSKIEVDSVDGYFMITDEDLKKFREETFFIPDMEYFEFMMKFFGYKYAVSDDIPKGNVLYTQMSQND